MNSDCPPLRILLIEDNPTDVLLLEEVFAELPQIDSELVHVERLESGLDCLRGSRFDIVLLDLGLPDCQGMETFIRLHRSHPDVPVLVLTALDDESVGVNALQAGAQDYLVKRRMEAPLLVRSVRYAIERHRVAAELEQRARELAESEERFQLALSGSAAGLWDWNLFTDEVYFSARFKRLLGFDPDAFPNELNAYLERIHPDDRARMRTSRIEHIEQRTPFDVEFRVLARSGEIRWVQSRAQALWNEEGVAHRMVGWIIDITDRRDTEERLRLHESVLKETGRIAKVGGWSFDPRTGEGFWTDEVARIYDIDSASATSAQLGLQHFEGEHRARIEAAIEAAVRDRQPYDLELELVSARGVRKWVRTIGHPVIENDAVVRLRGSIQDITDRVEAVRRIRRQADLLDRASDAIILRDLDNRVQFWSKGAERLYGWSAEEAMGRDLTAHLFKDPEVIVGPRAELIRDGEWSGELVQTCRDGREIHVHTRWTLLADGGGAPEAILSINSDVTAQKDLEARFLRAQRLESIGTLAGGIAHDFNNVLSPIMMAIALLRIRHEDEETDKLLQMLETSANRGKDLVRQVLGFSRGLDGERIILQPAHILNEIGNIAVDTFPKSIEVQVDCVKNAWLLHGDPTQIHQVVMNLCVNARDAMPGGGRLELKLENVRLDETYAQMHPDARPGPHVCIAVGDQGTGIPPEIRDRIFEPFFTTKETGRGTGLGLSTVRGIVRSHGGFINLYSELGRGTTFRVYLPASEADLAAAAAEAPRKLENLRGRGEMILLVDDEAAIRRVASRTLETFGYRVLTAANGAEGVSLYVLHRHEIAVVLSDLAMPVMDGLAMAHALKSIAPEVRMIGTSGLATAGVEAKLRDLGVEHFLNKPFVAENLLRSLRELIDGQPDPA